MSLRNIDRSVKAVCVFLQTKEGEKDENIYGGKSGSLWCYLLPFLENLAHEATISKNRSLNRLALNLGGPRFCGYRLALNLGFLGFLRENKVVYGVDLKILR